MEEKHEKNIAIIFAGGTGKRFGADIPKQFISVFGREIIIWTLEKFQNHPEIDEIYIGCIESWIPYLEGLITKYGISKVPVDGIVPGGTSGQDTIYRILKRARENGTDEDIVLINDGVRPIVTPREISENIRSVREKGAAVTCIPFQETPIYSNNGDVVEETLDRNKLYRGVAPQSFRIGHILDAHEKIRLEDPGYTGIYNGSPIVDSASLLRAAFNERCAIVRGNPNNIKVTNPNDTAVLKGLIENTDNINYYMTQNAEIRDYYMSNLESGIEINDALRYAGALDMAEEEVKKKF